MTRLLVIGGGGHGTVVAEAATEFGCWSDIAFLDDNEASDRTGKNPVLGHFMDYGSFLNDETEVVVAIGNNRLRLKLLHSIADLNGKIATVIHPAAVISRSALISAGTVVCAGVIVNARTTIGIGCILNTGATIDHHCEIGHGAHISPGASLGGGVKVGECTWVGIGASVKHAINIGHDSIVGAGAAVVSDVGDNTTVVGVPAKVMRSRSRDDK